MTALAQPTDADRGRTVPPPREADPSAAPGADVDQSEVAVYRGKPRTRIEHSMMPTPKFARCRRRSHSSRLAATGIARSPNMTTIVMNDVLDKRSQMTTVRFAGLGITDAEDGS